MPDKVNFLVRDHSEEYGHLSLNIPAVDETTWVATNTAIATLQSALDVLTIGEIAERSLTAGKVTVSTAIPADASAQRELGLRLFYRDLDSAFGAGKKFHVTVPCPNLDAIAQAGTNEVDITGVAIVSAVVTAMEAVMVSPYGGTVEFYKGIIVGRNN